MALTCSVLGHAYGEPTVERDREERGSEVVVTIREYETCHRCGTTRIVSENKEVTAVEAGEEAPEPITDRTTDVDAPPAPPEAEGTPAAPHEEGSEDVAPAGSDDVADEGAEILDAEAAAPIEDEAVDEELASPSVADETMSTADASDAGDASDASEEDDAVVIEAAADEDDGRAPGEWPEEDEPDGDEEWSPPSEPIESSTTEPEPAIGPTITVPEGEFHCEECGYSTPVESSSLRAGDFCPECHRGTLTHVRESS